MNTIREDLRVTAALVVCANLLGYGALEMQPRLDASLLYFAFFFAVAQINRKYS